MPPDHPPLSNIPIEQEEGEDSREVGGRGICWEVKHEQDDDAARGWHQVV